MVVTDNTGSVLDRDSYDAWGQRRNADGSDDTTYSVKGYDQTGYTGEEMLDTIGLVHLNGRVYDPLVGRFVSADPTIPDSNESQSLNRYTYVRNNPLNATDPTGFVEVQKGETVYIDACKACLRSDALNDSLAQLAINSHPRLVAQLAVPVTPPVAASRPTAQNIGKPKYDEDVLQGQNTSPPKQTLDEFRKLFGINQNIEDGNAEDKSSDSEELDDNDKSKDDKPASEKTAKDIAKRIERDIGKDARRDFHDAKDSGAGDRTLGQLKQDARDVYTQAGKDVPTWLK